MSLAIAEQHAKAQVVPTQLRPEARATTGVSLAAEIQMLEEQKSEKVDKRIETEIQNKAEIPEPIIEPAEETANVEEQPRVNTELADTHEPTVQTNQDIAPEHPDEQPAATPDAAPLNPTMDLETDIDLTVIETAAPEATTTAEGIVDFADEPLEADVAAEIDSELSEETIPPAELSIEEIIAKADIYSQKNIMQEMDDSVAEHFEKLEPEAREFAITTLENITAVLREIGETPAETEPEKLAEIEQQLTTFCEELFECLGLETTEDTIEWFAQSLINESITPGNEIDVTLPQEEGTHEQLKPDFHTLRKLLYMMKRTKFRLKLLGLFSVSVIPLPDTAAPQAI